MIYEREVLGRLFRYHSDTGEVFSHFRKEWKEKPIGTNGSHGYFVLKINRCVFLKAVLSNLPGRIFS